MRLIKYLDQPHPFVFNNGSLWVIALATFNILVLFRPFGYGEFTTSTLLLIAGANSIVAVFGIWLVVFLFRKLFPKWSRPEGWTVGKEIILILSGLTMIILMIFMLLWVSGFSDLPANTLFLVVVVKTLTLALVPVILLVLIEQYSHQRKKLKQAMAITGQLKRIRSASLPNSPKETIQIRSENGNLEVQLLPGELIYIKSEGNYLEVFFFQGELKKKLVRHSLKSVSQNLPPTDFFQSHKSYLINLNHIISVQGNARNLELTLRYVPEPIPVSRSKTISLHEILRRR